MSAWSRSCCCSRQPPSRDNASDASDGDEQRRPRDLRSSVPRFPPIRAGAVPRPDRWSNLDVAIPLRSCDPGHTAWSVTVEPTDGLAPCQSRSALRAAARFTVTGPMRTVDRLRGVEQPTVAPTSSSCSARRRTRRMSRICRVRPRAAGQVADEQRPLRAAVAVVDDRVGGDGRVARRASRRPARSRAAHRRAGGVTRARRRSSTRRRRAWSCACRRR